MQTNINFHIWYKVCRPVKFKYHVSVNVLLLLSGTYLLHKVTNKPFTKKQLLKFLTYYNSNKIKYYIGVLVNKGFVELNSISKNIEYYSITQAGISVINDLNDSYQIELSKFCQKYNIEL